MIVGRCCGGVGSLVSVGHCRIACRARERSRRRAVDLDVPGRGGRRDYAPKAGNRSFDSC
jgi:hypothetical protein